MLSSLSILIPTFNDEQTIESVITQADAVASKLAKKHEIIVLNDGSTNSIPDILKLLQKKFTSLKVMTHTVNKGYGETIKDLYYAGTCEWLGTLPGDDQINAQELVTMATKVQSEDIILGKRQHRGDHFFRRMQSWTYNTLLRILFSIPTTDVDSIRLMKRTIVQEIPLKYTSAFVDAELILKAHKKGYRICEIPIHHKSRVTAGATGGKFFKTILPTIIDLSKYYFLRT